MYCLKILVFCWTFSHIVVECDFLKGLLLGSNLREDDSSDTEIIVIRIPAARKKRPSIRRPPTTSTTTSTTTTTTTTTAAPTTRSTTRKSNRWHYSYGLETSALNTTAKPFSWQSRAAQTITNTHTSSKETNVCGANQTFTHCLNECGNTCESISKSPVCTLQCYGFGCTCSLNYVRDERSDRCVAQQDCPQPIRCPVGERFYECGGCGATCDNPFPDCSGVCKPMGECDCAKGLVRNVHRKCVPLSLCALNRSINIENRLKINSTVSPFENNSFRELLNNIQHKSNQNLYSNIH